MGINYVGLPRKLYLPFFAYGIFKPGQLAYSRIQEFVSGEPSAEIVDYEMAYRDGIALIRSGENEISKTSGYLIEFTNSRAAYEIIGKSEPEELYMWKQIKVNGEWANALVGVNVDCGSQKNRVPTLGHYNYREDPFFNEALNLIENTKDEFKDKEIIDMKDFFKLQMHYMLLWSIIERFCIFSYGYFTIGENIKEFAKERSFKDELKTVTRKDVIYSSDTLEDRYLDSSNSTDSIFYYYTIRCNVVHKGKTVDDSDMNKLNESLKELLRLFMAVYNDKLTKNNELLRRYRERRL